MFSALSSSSSSGQFFSPTMSASFLTKPKMPRKINYTSATTQGSKNLDEVSSDVYEACMMVQTVGGIPIIHMLDSSDSSSVSTSTKLMDNDVVVTKFVPGSRQKCTYCGNHLKNCLECLYHEAWHKRSYIRAACPHCETAVVDIEGLVHHMQHNHKPHSTFYCEKCTSEFDNLDSFVSHLRSFRAKTYYCTKCSVFFNSQFELTTHINALHGGDGLGMEVDDLTCKQSSVAATCVLNSSIQGVTAATAPIGNLNAPINVQDDTVNGRVVSDNIIDEESAMRGSLTSEETVANSVVTSSNTNNNISLPSCATSDALSAASASSISENQMFNYDNIPAERFHCKQCPFSSRWQSAVRRHAKKFHKKVQKTIVSNKTGLKKPLVQSTSSNEVTFYCDQCPFSVPMSYKTGIKAHQRMHSQAVSEGRAYLYACSICSYIHLKKRSVNSHVITKHGGKTVSGRVMMLPVSNTSS